MNTPSEADVLRDMLDQGTGPTGPDQVPGTVEEQPDGSALIVGEEQPKQNTEFYRNLAEELADTDLDTIAVSLLQLIDKDKEARSKRDEQYEEGLKRMGLDKESIGGANFTGASNVVHPMYTKACIDFEARSIKELMPPMGPTREYIPGTPTTERADRARRKAKWMNFQMMQGMPNFRPELEQMLMNLPMGGVQYIKLVPPTKGISIGHEWIPVDKMLLPFAAVNYYSSERRTHIQEVTSQEFDRRVRSGMYRDIPVVLSMEPEPTKAQKAAQRIDGNEGDGTNPDGVRIIYECDCIFEIKDKEVKGSHTESLQSDVMGEEDEDEASEPGPAPYLISIDLNSRKVLSIYRNWDEDDEDQKRLEWVSEWPFIPFRGAYALGLPHIIGGLSIAATGALRALLDSAHINNLAGLLKLKGPAGTGQTLRINPTEVTEVESSGETDDIRKLIMPVPFSPPSSVLFQLLGLLIQEGGDVVRTFLDESQDNTNVPVGTMQARIEQGLVVFSAIHGRLHSAMDRLLHIQHRINSKCLKDSDVMKALGEQLVTAADFQGPMDVVPVSDPNVFCELQRYGQIQAVAQRAQLLPQIYDLRKVEEAILRQLKLPNDGKDLLQSKPEPSQLNPVNENIALSLGRPIVAFPQQDHIAHIETHCDFYESQLFQTLVGGSLPAMSGLMQNLKEHLALWYGTQVHQIASLEATAAAQQRDPSSGKVDIGDLPQTAKADPQIGQLYDAMLAAASARVMQASTEQPQLQRAVKTIAQLQQQLKQMQPPQPTDPGAAAMAEVNRQQAKDQTDAKLKTQELAQDQQRYAQEDQSRIQQQIIRSQGDKEVAQEEGSVKQLITSEDNQTAIEIAGMRAAMGKGTNVTNGQAVGKSAPRV